MPPIPSATNTTMLHLLRYLDNGSNGLLGAILIVIIWAILFFLMKDYEIEKVAVASLFPSMMVGWMFYAIGLISLWWATTATVLFFLSVLVYWLSRRD